MLASRYQVPWLTGPPTITSFSGVGYIADLLCYTQQRNRILPKIPSRTLCDWLWYRLSDQRRSKAHMQYDPASLSTLARAMICQSSNDLSYVAAKEQSKSLHVSLPTFMSIIYLFSVSRKIRHLATSTPSDLIQDTPIGLAYNRASQTVVRNNAT